MRMSFADRRRRISFCRFHNFVCFVFCLFLVFLWFLCFHTFFVHYFLVIFCVRYSYSEVSKIEKASHTKKDLLPEMTEESPFSLFAFLCGRPADYFAQADFYRKRGKGLWLNYGMRRIMENRRMF